MRDWRPRRPAWSGRRASPPRLRRWKPRSSTSSNCTISTGEKVPRFLVLGQVVGIYVDDRFVKDGIIQTAQMQPIARCGYQDYAVVDEVFSLQRPAGGGNRAGGG